ncbi:glutathione S-transferase family protein [Paraburkholderia sp. RL17-347-BIC-D]|uniref:glutathione S-transferase family protein n=1 Tax=Paraburkholderia sp. RL17-347-BIC-D TaxID=3031632 RepID=UPI0038BB503E
MSARRALISGVTKHLLPSPSEKKDKEAWISTTQFTRPQHAAENTKVRLFLREKNIPFTVKMVEGLGSGAETNEFRKFNPRREVPVVKVGENTLFDSTIILEYLEEKPLPVGDPSRVSSPIVLPGIHGRQTLPRNRRRSVVRRQP